MRGGERRGPAAGASRPPRRASRRQHVRRQRLAVDRVQVAVGRAAARWASGRAGVRGRRRGRPGRDAVTAAGATSTPAIPCSGATRRPSAPRSRQQAAVICHSTPSRRRVSLAAANGELLQNRVPTGIPRRGTRARRLARWQVKQRFGTVIKAGTAARTAGARRHVGPPRVEPGSEARGGCSSPSAEARPPRRRVGCRERQHDERHGGRAEPVEPHRVSSGGSMGAGTRLRTGGSDCR
jgi:hypothetical protein